MSSVLGVTRGELLQIMQLVPPQTEMRLQSILNQAKVNNAWIKLVKGDGLYDLNEQDWEAVIEARRA